MPTLSELRTQYHDALRADLWGRRVNNSGKGVSKEVRGKKYPVFTNADGHNSTSVVLAAGSAKKARTKPNLRPSAGGSETGIRFESATRRFVANALGLFKDVQKRDLQTLPGEKISNFAQYAHLDDIERIVEGNGELQVALGGDYVVTPDIVVAFDPFPDSTLTKKKKAFDGAASLSPVRDAISSKRFLHASISCKWTMRRDRAQNTRTEALNLVRNRKGRLPHVVLVTMECAPDILASLALGTGDIDCLYHGALFELTEAADEAGDQWGGTWKANANSLRTMTQGGRLRDISDLPLDLLV